MGLTAYFTLAAVLSAVTFLVFWYDKIAATNGRRRVPERVLLGLSFAGGWPGGLLAQHAVRHKRRKSRFMWRFWWCVGLNLAAVLVGLSGSVS